MIASATRSYPSLLDYQQFFDRLSANTPAATEAVATQENVFQQSLIALLPGVPAGADQLVAILFRSVAGFKAMKKGQLDAGYALLEPALAALSTLPTDAQALAETLLSPMASFYHYRKSNFAEARRLADRSIALSNEWQHTYGVLHIHRIQQLFNLSRIDLAEGRYDAGFETIRQLANYLATGQTPTIDGYWDEAMLRRLPDALVAVQFKEIIDELTFLLLKKPELEPVIVNTILADLTLSLTNCVPGVPSPYAAIVDWTEAKQALSAHRYREFLIESAYFITQYPADYDQYKLSLLRDVNVLMARADPAVQVFRAQLGQHINRHLRLPARLIAHLRAARAAAPAIAPVAVA